MRHDIEPIKLDIEGVVSKLRSMIDENTSTVLRLIKTLRNQYGRKSEKVSPAQLMLALWELGVGLDLEAPIELPPERERVKKQKRCRPHGRRLLPAHLPREEQRVTVAEKERRCAKCGAEKEVIGHESSEMLEYVPASFKVRRILREKLAWRDGGRGWLLDARPQALRGGIQGRGDAGRLPIDNGACERAIRAVAVGRKNYLFAGSDAGGKRAAIAYSLLGSCALAGVDPWAYLKDVFEKLAGGWPRGKVFDLLPADWAEDHPEHRLPRAKKDTAPVVTNQPQAQVG